MLLSPMLVGGFGASFAAKPLSILLQGIMRLFGVKSDDPEEDMYKFFESNMGPMSARVARYGLPGLVDANLKGSVDVNNVGVPTSLVDIFGAPGAVIKDIYEGASEAYSGNVWKGLEGMVPNAVSSLSRAVRESTEGVTKKSNAPVFYGTEPLKLSFQDAVMKAMSFSPASMAEKKERLWSESKVKKKYNDDKSEIMDKYRRFYLLPLEKRSREKLYDLQLEVMEFNQNLWDHKISRFEVSPITPKGIRTSLRRTFIPSRMERSRAVTLREMADEDNGNSEDSEE